MLGSKNTDMTFALQRGGGQDMTGKAGGRDGDTVELATKVIRRFPKIFNNQREGLY